MVCDLDPLGERAEMVAAIAAAIDPDPLARRLGEPLDHLRRDGLMARGLQHRGGTRGVGLRPVADRLEARNALFQRRVVEIGDTGLDGVIEPLEPQVGFGGPLVQLGDMLAAALGTFLPAVEDGRQHLLEPLRLEQAIGDVLGSKIVEIAGQDITVRCLWPPEAWPNSSSKRSPNHASNTSSSASVIGTGSGQPSVTVHASTTCFGGRPMRGQGSGSM